LSISVVIPANININGQGSFNGIPGEQSKVNLNYKIILFAANGWIEPKYCQKTGVFSGWSPFK
jgi:hypothetical protein